MPDTMRTREIINNEVKDPSQRETITILSPPDLPS